VGANGDKRRACGEGGQEKGLAYRGGVTRKKGGRGQDGGGTRRNKGTQGAPEEIRVVARGGRNSEKGMPPEGRRDPGGV